MSLEAVRALMSRMSKDPEFKGRFMANREEAISEYDLTAEERDAVTRLGLGVDSSPRTTTPLGTWV